ncbi:MAG TPA: hypothetical protein VMV04_23625 [Thermodesulfobacteriota bacterium]|nr:hypothetical protein [Thermodesulfobacteriota bacterium]
MAQDEKIKEAQEVLDWAIVQGNGTVKCRVISYKHNSYRVHFFTKDQKLIMPVQIDEEDVKETKPKENVISDKLKTLLKNLEAYS